MQKFARKACVFASFLIAGTALVSVSAHASTHKIAHTQHVAAAHHHTTKRVASTRHTSSHSKTHQTASLTRHSAAQKERVTYTVRRHGKTYTRTVWRTRTHDAHVSNGVYHGYLECVPYARKVSGIALSGNADTWWNEAPGRYERGHAPAAGAVLNFRANGRMRLGHVAVVQEVVNPREVLITQANWGGPGFVRGGVSSDISVVDVSPRNDWTAVRVALGHSSTYGSVYPTYGFIYQGSAPTTRMAEAGPAPMVDLGNRPPADLRSATERRRAKSLAGTIQYAAAPSFDGPAIASSAPDRNLR
ncbi:MAG TPA: CHAP domain-containing protein [Acidisoma sp.]|uniref:CHAP domain-containing protein n=1 Tax=Acidisoma sp. TaxID=1872115 RepID=UPI002BDD78B6|nr:CHAP domain-containing protein [Acidisoma sp.]HTI01721.1 CHAP domain-containing protein [Acidisoma sp.]